jgi:uroporphyrinogen-III synthase
VAVLRPEPGNAATCARLRAAGLEPLPLPLFAVRPLGWDAPDPAAFDALLLTSVNALRHAGPALARYSALPVLAVGEATAAAARDAGFRPALVGDADVAALLAATDARRILHLSGRERTGADPRVTAVPVYASDPLPVAPEPLAGTVALLHSPRAARRLAAIAGDLRPAIRVAALSPAVAEAAGPGWAALAAAPAPTDATLVALARTLAD